MFKGLQLSDLYAPELFPEALMTRLGMAEFLPFNLWGAWPQQLFNMPAEQAPFHFWQEVGAGKHMDDLEESKQAFIDLGRFGVYVPTGRKHHETPSSDAENYQPAT